MQAPSHASTTLVTWHELTPRNFQLRQDSQSLAILYWPHPVGASAIGETSSHHYTFKQISRFGPHVRITNANTGEHVATLGKGSLNESDHVTLSSGETFSFKPVLAGDLLVEDSQGIEVMTLCNSETHSDRQITCIIPGAGDPLSAELLLLAILGLYLLELQYEDDLAAIMAATGLLRA